MGPYNNHALFPIHPCEDTYNGRCAGEWKTKTTRTRGNLSPPCALHFREEFSTFRLGGRKNFLGGRVTAGSSEFFRFSLPLPGWIQHQEGTHESQCMEPGLTAISTAP